MEENNFAKRIIGLLFFHVKKKQNTIKGISIFYVYVKNQSMRYFLEHFRADSIILFNLPTANAIDSIYVGENKKTTSVPRLFH